MEGSFVGREALWIVDEGSLGIDAVLLEQSMPRSHEAATPPFADVELLNPSEGAPLPPSRDRGYELDRPRGR